MWARAPPYSPRMFIAIGMEAFAERARIELVATGETVRRRTIETRDEPRLRRSRLRASLATASPIPRSEHGCSSVHALSNGTWKGVHQAGDPFQQGVAAALPRARPDPLAA